MRSHIAVCLMVGWLQFILKLKFISNNYIIILIGEIVIAHSLSYNWRMAKLSPKTAVLPELVLGATTKQKTLGEGKH